jgi:hyperosmotically inducible protein
LRWEKVMEEKIMTLKIPYRNLTAPLSMALVVLSLGAGCKRQDTRSASSAESSYAPVVSMTNPATAEDLARQRAAMEREKSRTTIDPLAADNTRVNVRDRVDSVLLEGDSGATAADRDISEQIRKGLSTDAAYSAVAPNVKIITAQGQVTLRGPVNTQSEKDGILSLARTIAGADKVDDQLEVKQPYP